MPSLAVGRGLDEALVARLERKGARVRARERKELIREIRAGALGERKKK